MNTTTARPNPRSRHSDMEPLRFRAELPTVSMHRHPLIPLGATHDFLVPNPRPDLTLDLHFLRMIEAG